MQQASTAEDFLADPIGKYVGGRSFVAWAQSAASIGAAFHGTFESNDVPALTTLMALPVNPSLVTPYDVLFDASSLAFFDQSAFELLTRFLTLRIEALRTHARRLALVRTRSLHGTTLSGVLRDWVHAPVEAEAFDDLHAALRWLGKPPGSTAGDEIDALVAAHISTPPLVRRVREHVAADPHGMTLERTAAALGDSARSLQRHLSQLGTSFRDELTRVRIDHARRLLVDTDDKLDALAAQLGFRSTSAFVNMFTRLVGESPTDYRQRQRELTSTRRSSPRNRDS